MQRTREALDHITGNSPRSLGLPPALYFYTTEGRYVRSLLYGLIYWLTTGTTDDILQRKKVFCAYRAGYERVLIDRKEDFVTGLSRRSGSGAEVTVQTASYYNGLLDSLAEHEGNVESEGFEESYTRLVNRILERRTRTVPASEGKARLFTPRQKSMTFLRALLQNPATCGICGGVLDLTGAVQHDHVTEFSRGGLTVADNNRLTHPFCNNNRPAIEAIQGGTAVRAVPRVEGLGVDIGLERQLKLFDDIEFR